VGSFVFYQTGQSREARVQSVQSVGTVREWHTQEGWGVIDCPDTPGG
jgi:hypothetical protein